MPYEQARAILEQHATPVGESAWPAWAARHDADIRARLARGDEDSIVYLWLYGTTFTKAPRATEQELARLAAPKREALLLQRLDDLIAGASSPGANERLRFARALFVRRGVNLATAAGRDRAAVILVEARARVIAENDRYRNAADAARRSTDTDAAIATYSTLFRDRGLSSDTRLTAGFAIDRALAALAAAGRIAPGALGRAAVVGPGLDFTDKAEGYDFYPQQTIQPFALLDSLARLGLARPGGVRLATLDLSPRVNAHLDAARAQARARRPYVLQLPLAADDEKHEWQPDLVEYWRTLAVRIGKDAPPLPAPPGAGVRVRAVAIEPGVVLSIVPSDLDVIVQRLPLDENERFDLVVATNILVYYDAFDQALALSNIASMLRPGGYFLTNYAVASSASMQAVPELTTRVFFDRQNNGDTVYCYERR
jgi:SAM-dependent methyltransferase